jgi:hypothetical protein
VVAGAALAAAAVIGALPRIPQDPAYHRFADRRTIWGLPHGLDVWSNLAFPLVGLWGLIRVLSAPAGGSGELRGGQDLRGARRSDLRDRRRRQWTHAQAPDGGAGLLVADRGHHGQTTETGKLKVGSHERPGEMTR